MPETHGEHHDEAALDSIEPPLSLSHFVHVLRAYSAIILISVAGIMVLYSITAIAIYFLAPSQQITAVPFRLEFEGASKGEYPNKSKFSVADVVTTPILLKVFSDNQLDKFTTFPAFSHSVVVLEHSRAAEQLATEYQTKLADARLTPLDRDRIQKELEQKRAALPRNEYAIFFLSSPETEKIPHTKVLKVLTDTLVEWKRYEAVEQRVLQYQVSVLSPDIVNPSPSEGEDFVAAIVVLRSRILRVLDNIDDVARLPGAIMVRTRDDHASLQEIQVRLNEIMRFRLEPLVGVVCASGLVRDRVATTQFLESQLAYDQRRLKGLQSTAESIRQSLSSYLNDKRTLEGELKGAESKAGESNASGRITPQLGDAFLDRLVTLANLATDTPYRQKIATTLQNAELDIIPAEQAVSYDLEALNQIKSASRTTSTDPVAVRAQIEDTRRAVRELIAKVNEVYQGVSRNLESPSTFYSTPDSAFSRTEHSVTFLRLALIGLAVLLISIPVVIAICLLVNRVREEETVEE